MREQTKECIEILEKWDSGEPVTTIEMGGLGPGYEQALQVCAFEMLRYIIINPIDFDKADTNDEGYWENYKKGRDKFIWDDFSPCKNLGLSGAQAGAAGNISAMFFRYGPAKARSLAPEDRSISVTNETVAEKDNQE